MSHAIDTDGLRQNLFLLRNVALARELYATEENFPSETLNTGGYFDGFSGLLKSYLSNTIIDASVKLRIIQEYCDPYELNKCEKFALRDLTIGQVLVGSFKLTLRESFNKVIHSELVSIEFRDLQFSGAGCWDNRFELNGTHNSKPWKLELYVSEWSRAVYRYLDEIEENGLIEKLGN